MLSMADGSNIGDLHKPTTTAAAISGAQDDDG
jgi:hypothetical protein